MRKTKTVKFSLTRELRKINRSRPKPTAKERANLKELLANESEIGGQQPGTWPMRSLAMAVHPKDARAANELLAKAGLSARHDKTGKLVIPDRGEHKRVMKYRSRPGMQMVDFDSFM